METLKIEHMAMNGDLVMIDHLFVFKQKSVVRSQYRALENQIHLITEPLNTGQYGCPVNQMVNSCDLADHLVTGYFES